MDSYDNDLILLLLDDDLFIIEDDNDVDRIQPEPKEAQSRRLHGKSDMRSYWAELEHSPQSVM